MFNFATRLLFLLFDVFAGVLSFCFSCTCSCRSCSQQPFPSGAEQYLKTIPQCHSWRYKACGTLVDTAAEISFFILVLPMVASSQNLMPPHLSVFLFLWPLVTSICKEPKQERATQISKIVLTRLNCCRSTSRIPALMVSQTQSPKLLANQAFLAYSSVHPFPRRFKLSWSP